VNGPTHHHHHDDIEGALPAKYATVDDEANPASCSTCKKVLLTTTHNTQLTKENTQQKKEVLSEHITKLVKPRNQNSFSISSPVHHLRSVTPDLASRLKDAARAALGGQECATVAQFAALSDADINAIRGRDPTGFRHLPALQATVRELVSNADEEEMFRKRAQNAACCHRFRERKKVKMATLEKTLDDMISTCRALTGRIEELERERDSLASQQQPQQVHPCDHISTPGHISTTPSASSPTPTPVTFSPDPHYLGQ